MLKSRRAVLIAMLTAAPLGMAYAQYPGGQYPGGQYPGGQHPRYLHALSDLRAARWLLENRRGDAAVSFHESTAIEEIEHAIRTLKEAAIDDGRDIHDHPPADVPVGPGPGRLHKADELLRGARADLSVEEDNPEARHLRHRAFEHIDRALQEVDAAIWDVERRR